MRMPFELFPSADEPSAPIPIQLPTTSSPTSSLMTTPWPLPEMRLRREGSEPPMTIPWEVSIRMPRPLPSPSPGDDEPMVFASMTSSVAEVMSTPSSTLAAITFPGFWPATGIPPMSTLGTPLISIPSPWFPFGRVPVGSVPMKLPRISVRSDVGLSVTPKALREMPSPTLFEMTLA